LLIGSRSRDMLPTIIRMANKTFSVEVQVDEQSCSKA
jgi:hypothetical protein